jgi:hypothetical protein
MPCRGQFTIGMGGTGVAGARPPQARTSSHPVKAVAATATALVVLIS